MTSCGQVPQEQAYFKQSLDDLQQSLGTRPKTWTETQSSFAKRALMNLEKQTWCTFNHFHIVFVFLNSMWNKPEAHPWIFRYRTYPRDCCRVRCREDCERRKANPVMWKSMCQSKTAAFAAKMKLSFSPFSHEIPCTQCCTHMYNRFAINIDYNTCKLINYYIENYWNIVIYIVYYIVYINF